MKNPKTGMPTRHPNGIFPGELDGRNVRITGISEERMEGLMDDPTYKVWGAPLKVGEVYPVISMMESGVPADYSLMILDRYEDEFCLCVSAKDGSPLDRPTPCHGGVTFEFVA